MGAAAAAGAMSHAAANGGASELHHRSSRLAASEVSDVEMAAPAEVGWLAAVCGPGRGTAAGQLGRAAGALAAPINADTAYSGIKSERNAQRCRALRLTPPLTPARPTAAAPVVCRRAG